MQRAARNAGNFFSSLNPRVLESDSCLRSKGGKWPDGTNSNGGLGVTQLISMES